MADTSKKTKGGKKVKVDKFNGFKVPSGKGKFPSIRWCRHVYDMIEEANPALLKRDDVRDAYNAVIDCCRKYDGTLESWIPSKYNKYRDGVKPNPLNKYSQLQSLPCRFTYEYDTWNNPDLKMRLQTECADIIKSYTVLYDLIKRDVVPYMETKQHEINCKKTIEFYQHNMENLEKKIKEFERHIETYRKTIADYAAKCTALQAGPVLTKFD